MTHLPFYSMPSLKEQGQQFGTQTHKQSPHQACITNIHLKTEIYKVSRKNPFLGGLYCIWVHNEGGFQGKHQTSRGSRKLHSTVSTKSPNVNYLEYPLVIDFGGWKTPQSALGRATESTLRRAQATVPVIGTGTRGGSEWVSVSRSNFHADGDGQVTLHHSQIHGNDIS